METALKTHGLFNHLPSGWSPEWKRSINRSKISLPSEVKNEIHPAKEQGDCTSLQFITCLTVARGKDENKSSNVADPLHQV